MKPGREACDGTNWRGRDDTDGGIGGNRISEGGDGTAGGGDSKIAGGSGVRGFIKGDGTKARGGMLNLGGIGRKGTSWGWEVEAFCRTGGGCKVDAYGGIGWRGEEKFGGGC